MPVADVIQAAVSSEAVAWLAFATGLFALGKQAYDIFKKRNTEKKNIQEALDRQPLDQQGERDTQLEPS